MQQGKFENFYFKWELFFVNTDKLELYDKSLIWKSTNSKFRESAYPSQWSSWHRKRRSIQIELHHGCQAVKVETTMPWDDPFWWLLRLWHASQPKSESLGYRGGLNQKWPTRLGQGNQSETDRTGRTRMERGCCHGISDGVVVKPTRDILEDQIPARWPRLDDPHLQGQGQGQGQTLLLHHVKIQPWWCPIQSIEALFNFHQIWSFSLFVHLSSSINGAIVALSVESDATMRFGFKKMDRKVRRLFYHL